MTSPCFAKILSFGVTGAVADPMLELTESGGCSVAVKDNWGGTAESSEAFAAVGALTLEPSIAGFTIGGTTSKTVLIRAIGPSLAGFGVSGVLADPRLELFSGAVKLNENDDWGGYSVLSGAFSSVGAFALGAASKDAALLLTLPTGSYTAQVSGTNNTTGVALVEVYEVP